MTLTSLFIEIFHNLYQGFCCCVQIEERVTVFFAYDKVACFHRCYTSPSSTTLAATPSTAYTLAYPGGNLLLADDIVIFGRPKLRSHYEKIKQPVLDSESMGRGPKSSASVTQTQDSRLPSVDSRWRKWRTSLILAASSPWMRTQSICHVLTTSSWNSPSVSLQIKLWLLATIIVPTTTYVCKTWKMTEAIARKLYVFHLRCLRLVLKITYRDHVSNVEVYPLCNVTECCFCFAGHILRPPDR